MSVVIILILALTSLIPIYAKVHGAGKICDELGRISLSTRPHSVSITDFGAVGDGKTLNTLAFQNAVFYLMSFADKGGAQLYVPPGNWLTGSFSLTSHLTLFLENGAVIVASQDPSHWELVDPLPSYGRGIDLPGKRYKSLINGNMLHDVVVTGDNGTIDGQGLVWWDRFTSHSLQYNRPHLIEFLSSENVIVSNLTFLNAPAYTIHSIYSSHVYIHKILAHSSPESPYTIGIVPDSSDYVCIQNSTINVGYDAISLKSGWDEYGIAYSRPTQNVHIRNVYLRGASGSSISFGSEMSGGISDVVVDNAHIHNSLTGIAFRTTRGRGGYIKEINISNIDMSRIGTAIVANGSFGSHPDDKYDVNALPLVSHIRLSNISGENIGIAGKLFGIKESPFSSVSLSNVSLSMSSGSSVSWQCSYVYGSSESVIPEPCPELKRDDDAYGRAAV
ncbi:Glycoside hydrolase family 28 [Arabidopsis thaliana x Arabidopsis arenosa]|uniref:Glycoside hydrolase family 28 n=2 Tax=Arabidopsis thaliana x Arabidopsis arenosa TaxID=1240361 RepID=A0A8T2AWG4_9BRAS|nr:Glycoside hydrolase family 28 [Arabidopsis thaliana x Arabidopsis arenosa]